MRLPFVSRESHDVTCALLASQSLQELRARDERITWLQAQLEKEQERSEFLMDTVLSLKVSGATSILRATAAGLAVKLEPKPRSAIEQAIDENPKASSNPMLRGHLARWAERQLRARPEKMSEEAWIEQVCDELRTWSAVSEDDDDDDEGDRL